MYEQIVYCNANVGEAFLQIELAGTSYCDGTYSIRRERSGYHVFEFIESGSGTIVLDGREFHPEEGDVYLLKQDEPHWYYSSGDRPWVKHFINVRGALADHLIAAYALPGGLFPNCRVSACFETIFSLLRGGASSNQSLLPIAFHELVSAIAASRAKSETSDAEKIKLFLDEHIRQPVQLADLSRLIFKSPSQVNRLFKREYGQSPYHYLAQRRLSNASMLLQNTNMSIRQIALELQFADEHYFSNAFKRFAGLSPSRFRKESGGIGKTVFEQREDFTGEENSGK
ncbi:helix-turn-helix domain-containing protein [Gorillibacterium sp. sgz500922]|uniref:helix-turn-helix domain-containing protein n=1 Tax=Gorillibacterium sp. sgz500922 TaxID=3446694 RepID=UPI003F67DE2E